MPEHIPQAPREVDPDAHLDFLEKKAKRRYKAQKRKFRRDAENDYSELNLTAMMDMMTILLVFLIKSYGSTDIAVAMGDDLKPPVSSSALVPVEAITVTVTKKTISVESRQVVALTAEGKVPPDALVGPLIVPLRDELQAAVDKTRSIAEYNPRMRDDLDTERDPTRMLTVIADQDMPYELLYSVLGSAGQAGLKYFKLLVISSTS